MVTLQEKFIMINKYRSEALTQHADQHPDPATGARAVSIYQTTCYVFENAQDGENQLAMKKPAFIYSRLANPTGMYWNALISITPLSAYGFGWIVPFLIGLVAGSLLWPFHQAAVETADV